MFLMLLSPVQGRADIWELSSLKSGLGDNHGPARWKLSVALPPALHFMINCTRKIAANQNAPTQVLAH
jgi:hypothetical protein